MEHLIQIFRRPWSSIKAHAYLFILLLPILLPGPPSYAEEDAVGWLTRGRVLIMFGESLQDAINCFDKALEINPKYVEAWYNKAEVLGSLGRYEEAINCYDKALELNPKYANAWHNKGLSLEVLGKKDEAEKCFKKASELGLEPAGKE